MSENYNATGGMDGRQDGAPLHGSNQLGPHLINCKGNYDGHCEAPLENVLCLHQLFCHGYGTRMMLQGCIMNSLHMPHSRETLACKKQHN